MSKDSKILLAAVLASTAIIVGSQIYLQARLLRVSLQAVALRATPSAQPVAIVVASPSASASASPRVKATVRPTATPAATVEATPEE